MKLHIPLIILLMVLSLNCNSAKKRVICVNIDCSNSTEDKYVRDSYREDFRKILLRADEGDVIYVDRISSNSLSTSDPLIMEVPVYSIFGMNKDIFTKVTDSLKRDFADKCESYFLDPEYTQTDILNSLSKSIVFLNKDKYRDFKKVIVLFSDMIQETDELNLTEGSADEKKISKLISILEKDGNLLDLDSIEVYTGGATYSDQKSAQVSLKQTKFIKDFWKAYFMKCNMKFRDEMFGARLGDF